MDYSPELYSKLSEDQSIRQILVTDAIDHPSLENNPKFKIMSMAEIFGTAIQIIMTGGSIDKLVNRR